jgi:hypothetical protein
MVEEFERLGNFDYSSGDLNKSLSNSSDDQTNLKLSQLSAQLVVCCVYGIYHTLVRPLYQMNVLSYVETAARIMAIGLVTSGRKHARNRLDKPQTGIGGVVLC